MVSSDWEQRPTFSGMIISAAFCSHSNLSRSIGTRRPTFSGMILSAACIDSNLSRSIGTRPGVRAISVNLVVSIVFTPIRYYTNIPHVLLALQLAAKGERISRSSATSHSIHCLNVVSSTTSAPPLRFNQATLICKRSRPQSRPDIRLLAWNGL
jgi:hypothetical protein